jgi:hypothetical protein
MRFRPANIRVINRRQNLPRLLLALSLKNHQSNPIDVQTLTGHSISILCRYTIRVVDYEEVDGHLGRLQSEAELFLDSCEQ